MPHARERVTSSLVNAEGAELQPFGQRITVLRAAYVGRRPGVTQVYVLVGLLPSGGGAVGPGALAQQRHETAGSQVVTQGALRRLHNAHQLLQIAAAYGDDETSPQGGGGAAP